MTVRELRERILSDAKCADHFEFNLRSPLHEMLMRHVNRLGGRGIPLPGEPIPPDVDAAVELTDDEADYALACASFLPRGSSNWMRSWERRKVNR